MMTDLEAKSEKPRWVYRFDNFERAFFLLKDGMNIKTQRPLTDLEKEGIIQRFEYTWELAWKTLKDYLEVSGIILPTITPASTIKAAFAAGLIDKADIWMKALDARNKMSHTYNLQIFEKVIIQIENDFLPLFEEAYEKLHSFIESSV